MCSIISRNYFQMIYTWFYPMIVICNKIGCLASYFNISKVVDDRLWLNREDIKQSGSHKNKEKQILIFISNNITVLLDV